MLNALLNLLLFYNKIYAFHLVVVAVVSAAGKRYAERARKSVCVCKRERKRERGRCFGNRVKNLFHEMKTHTNYKKVKVDTDGIARGKNDGDEESATHRQGAWARGKGHWARGGGQRQRT